MFPLVPFSWKFLLTVPVNVPPATSSWRSSSTFPMILFLLHHCPEYYQECSCTHLMNVPPALYPWIFFLHCSHYVPSALFQCMFLLTVHECSSCSVPMTIPNALFSWSSSLLLPMKALLHGSRECSSCADPISVPPTLFPWFFFLFPLLSMNVHLALFPWMFLPDCSRYLCSTCTVSMKVPPALFPMIRDPSFWSVLSALGRRGFGKNAIMFHQL